jgi:aminoglycoside phosphotransferase family enzyme/predicted kinase
MTGTLIPNVTNPDQDAVLAFLGSGIKDGRTKRVDTHISIVFLEPTRVLKIKRAIRLPFLDYSTLDKRQHACEEELAVNRRYAPGIYRRVVAITRGPEGFQIGGNGPAVEWAVEMARFDESKTLDHLANAGKLSPELAEELAEAIYDSHRRAETSEGSTWLASIASIIDRNTDKFREQASLAPELIEHLHQVSHEQLTNAQGLLRERASGGMVRRCHGDAHLGNIVLIDNKPVLFDAIEFDPTIAITDTLYDLAFPIMDLTHFDLNAAANRLFNRYLEKSWLDNADALRLLPLFLSMRAAIRSHVLFTRSEQSGGRHAARGVAKSAASYFDLALRLLKPSPPSLTAIGGKSGTGKSVLARDAAALIGKPTGAVILRSDVIRKDLFAVDPLATLPRQAYAPEVSERVYRALNERAGRILAQGYSVIIDAAFLRKSERDKLSMEAARLGADFRPIFLTADLDVRLRRVASRRHDASDATNEVVRGQEDDDIGSLDWQLVDASGSPRQTLERSTAFLVPRRK